MRPQVGWVWLSRQEREAAEGALADLGPDGTRDELGFGAIHFAYSDRFFPGTSVQHTSLRYVWFVCWIYQDLARRFPGAAFPLEERKRLEDQVGIKLLDHYGPGDGTGIIGGRVLSGRRSPVTKPSGVYWNAMRTWGIVAPLPRNDESPARSELEWRWPELTDRHARPEVDATGHHTLFVDPPPPPKDWKRARSLDFALDEGNGEARRIREAWSAQRDHLNRQTLLSRLAEQRKPAPASLVSKDVLKLCSTDEQESLVRATRAGALAGIARTAHTLMVEQLKPDNAAMRAKARQWLDQAVDDLGADALQLDLPGLLVDVKGLGSLQVLIEATQYWLRSGAGDLTRLEPVYRAREVEQRPGRALLGDGEERRSSWTARQRFPLTYRWEKVGKFLDELAAT